MEVDKDITASMEGSQSLITDLGRLLGSVEMVKDRRRLLWDTNGKADRLIRSLEKYEDVAEQLQADIMEIVDEAKGFADSARAGCPDEVLMEDGWMTHPVRMFAVVETGGEEWDEGSCPHGATVGEHCSACGMIGDDDAE